MILSVKNASFSYKKQENILNNINLCAESGDVLAILGPNGAGKTTLLRCIMGFLKWNAGNSMIDGVDIQKLSYRELWQKISYVPQARSTATVFTALEMVLLGRASKLNIFGKPGEKDIDKAIAIMKRLNIARLCDKKCSEISGGELQMVLIARALASEPKILILDEPESNLDFKNQLVVLQTISELAADGMACIFNTHYPAHALQRANKSLILSNDGSFIFGNTTEVLTENNIEKAFGVKAYIGEFETKNAIIKNVMPVSVASDYDDSFKIKDADKENSIAVISVISSDYAAAEKINAVFYENKTHIVGRMGMPYENEKKEKLYIINAVFNAPAALIDTVAAKLSAINGASVKTTYSKP